MYFLRLDSRGPWRQAKAAAATKVLYDGFRVATEAVVPAARAGVLTDTDSASVILRDAAARGFTTACAVGRVGHSPVDVDGARAAAVHAASCGATFWRLVVHHNPEGAAWLDGGQMVLRQLEESLDSHGTRLMIDLVVTPTREQIAAGIRAYDRYLLPELTACAIAQLLDIGANPHVWVIEGFERTDDYRRIIATAGRGSRYAGCLVRAAGHGETATRERMAAGLSTPGVIGVILGGAPFWEPVAEWARERISRAAAVRTVAQRFGAWVSQLEGRPEFVSAAGVPLPGAAEWSRHEARSSPTP